MGYESVKKIAEADFPTRGGAFRIFGFEGVLATPRPCGAETKPVRSENGGPASRGNSESKSSEVEGLVALVMGDIHSAPPVVRIHSQCLTGDVFGSLRCDCRLQLELAMRRIADEGAGILLYEQQEGRGIGLMAKLCAYELQDHGLDTVEANVELGFAADCRAYELPAEVLKLLGVTQVRLITNNPEKVAALESAGIEVIERISAEVEPQESFADYVRTKQEKMGHIQDSVPGISQGSPAAEKQAG
jgi:GTP cyclohydrolase II